ncbi:hypothetical protein EDB81DRAFT_130776 [Dactylonectria macrodidyma]|uniref:Uncharacterized protein n=1 Tax=Dactylonectria macrodidyma TaxID=307937 RepID=A0A9P9IQ90_9HYPO|nr:hypothetical protein EDB81DRAFT_130776 [Dactylonectria macrodidyma]
MPLVRSPARGQPRTIVIDPENGRYARARSADPIYNRREREMERERNFDHQPVRIIERERARPERERDQRDNRERGRAPRPYYEDYDGIDDDEFSDAIHHSDASSDIIQIRAPPRRGSPSSPPPRRRREASLEPVQYREVEADTRRRASTYRPSRRPEPPRAAHMRRDTERDRDREKRRSRVPRMSNFFDEEDDDFRPQFYRRDSHPRRAHGNGGVQYVVPPPGVPNHAREHRHHHVDPYLDYQQYPSHPAAGYYSAPNQRPPQAPTLNMPYAGASATPFEYPQPGPPDLNAYARERAVMQQMPMPGPPDLNAYPRERSMPHQQPMSMPPDLNAYHPRGSIPHQQPLSMPPDVNAYHRERNRAHRPPMAPGPPDLNSYVHERDMFHPTPILEDPARPPPAREALYAEPRGYSPSYEAEKAARETADAEKHKELIDSIRREVDNSLGMAALAQEARGERLDTWAKKETERRLEFEAKMREEMEQLFAKAAEEQRQRNEKTENWARKEVERRRLFEEMIQAEVDSATRAIRTTDEEQGAKEEEVSGLRALAEDRMQKSEQALKGAERLRNDFHVIEVDVEEEEVYAPPPPPAPASPPRSSSRYDRGRRWSRSPPWGPTSPPPEGPEPPETETEEGEGAERDEESETPRCRQRSYRRRYESSVDSSGTYSSLAYCERDEVKRRELRRVREELLDPILDSIGALTTAVMFGGSHFNSPPAFMHYPPQRHASDTSRSFSSYSESDKETVTPKNELPKKQEQKKSPEPGAVVIVPDVDDQESSSAEMTPSGTPSEQSVSAENRSSGTESWVTATEDVVEESKSAGYMAEDQEVIDETNKEDDTDEAPTLVNFESADHTAAGEQGAFETDLGPLDSENEGGLHKNRQTVDNELIESHPKESSDPPGKELLAPAKDPNAESEDVRNPKPQPSTSDKRPKHQRAGDSRYRYWDGSYTPKKRADFEGPDTTDRRGRVGGQGRKGRHGYEKMVSMPMLQSAFIPIPYFHPVFGGVPPDRSRRRRGGDEEPMVD